MTRADRPKISAACEQCRERSQSSFCNLPEAAFAELQLLKVSREYKRGSIIFMEGQPARGVYLLCSGHVKLSTYSEDGKAIILRFADPGEVLGLGSLISVTQYEKTARAIDDCVVSFIGRNDFLEFVQRHREAA